jgi:hypothetical protein
MLTNVQPSKALETVSTTTLFSSFLFVCLFYMEDEEAQTIQIPVAGSIVDKAVSITGNSASPAEVSPSTIRNSGRNLTTTDHSASGAGSANCDDSKLTGNHGQSQSAQAGSSVVEVEQGGLIHQTPMFKQRLILPPILELENYILPSDGGLPLRPEQQADNLLNVLPGRSHPENVSSIISYNS